MRKSVPFQRCVCTALLFQVVMTGVAQDDTIEKGTRVVSWAFDKTR